MKQEIQEEEEEEEKELPAPWKTRSKWPVRVSAGTRQNGLHLSPVQATKESGKNLELK